MQIFDSLYGCLFGDFGEQNETRLWARHYWKSSYDVRKIIYLLPGKYLMWEHLSGLKLYFSYIGLAWLFV